ncbi:hypothetical protein [uncultured Pseudomonas sp.]|uniref:hypothetical protein n=1 Tax=uncultured Pseudomonas sp. TaxID=114707 RepID=UPI00258B2B5B|nr:hypothetical protein [uncultured Pseudomonas sp.]
MKPVDESGNPEREAQMAFSFEAFDAGDQSHLQMPSLIKSAAAYPLAESKVVAFPQRAISSADAGLIARVLQRTRHFV